MGSQVMARCECGVHKTILIGKAYENVKYK